METKQEKKNNPYIKYSGIAVQMALIIVAGTFGGKWIDKTFEFHFPVFTLIFAILSVVLAVYYAIKDIIKFNS